MIKMSPEEEEKTTIQITKVTRDKLKNLGKKGDTYDEIINSLIQQKQKTK
jgi:DNA replicative helicase MCM subunit Mcm2 (Cdc46/Mcm family)